MRYIVTGTEMKQADKKTIEEYGMPSLVLMERAALQCVQKMKRRKLNCKRVLVVCGSGNNGGDGFAIARLLHLDGAEVDIAFVGNKDHCTEETSLQMKIAENYGLFIDTRIPDKEYTVIIDAVFGVGLDRDIKGSYVDVIHKLNRMHGTKVAVDIPSGVHAATGKIMGTAFHADYTMTFAFEKRGTILYPGRKFAGRVLVLDIGITDDALDKEEAAYTYEKEDLTKLLPKRRSNSNKGSFGKVLLIVGTKGMSGAAYLCAKAAYTSGAGLIRIYTPEENRIVLQQLIPEAMISTYDTFDPDELDELMHWADVIGIGCGIGQKEISELILSYVVMHTEKPCVIDADGLNLLSAKMELLKANTTLPAGNFVLTPHMKEMSRLIEKEVTEIAENRMEILRRFVEEYPVVCALKDARTVVGTKGKAAYINTSGNAAMAKGGSGDVLTGIITGLMAQHLDGQHAATLGVYLHGLCGDRAKARKGAYSVLASDIIEALSDVLKERRKGEMK